MISLHHPNIVRLHEVFETGHKLYIVMELATGGDLLRKVTQHGTLDELRCWRVIAQLCLALRHVHARGIVHRDLKPENLLFTSPAEDAPIKVTDFGLSARRVLGGREQLPKLVNSSSWLTRRKSIVGTPSYAPVATSLEHGRLALVTSVAARPICPCTPACRLVQQRMAATQDCLPVCGQAATLMCRDSTEIVPRCP